MQAAGRQWSKCYVEITTEHFLHLRPAIYKNSRTSVRFSQFDPKTGCVCVCSNRSGNLLRNYKELLES